MHDNIYQKKLESYDQHDLPNPFHIVQKQKIQTNYHFVMLFCGQGYYANNIHHIYDLGLVNGNFHR